MARKKSTASEELSWLPDEMVIEIEPNGDIGRMSSEFFEVVTQDSHLWQKHRDRQGERSRAGVTSKRDKRARKDEKLLKDVRAGLAKGWSMPRIALGLLRQEGKAFDPQDHEGRRAIAAKAAVLRRLLHRS